MSRYVTSSAIWDYKTKINSFTVDNAYNNYKTSMLISFFSYILKYDLTCYFHKYAWFASKYCSRWDFLCTNNNW
jgi:hypothetical protein